MFRRFALVFIAAFCFNVSAFADTGSEITTFLNEVVDSFNSQDCQRYSSLFKEKVRTKKRRDAGVFFASNNSTMRLIESHVIADGEGEAEVAVAYSIDSVEYASRIFLEKEGGQWKIDREVFIKNSEGMASLDSEPQVYTSNPFPNRSVPAKTASASSSESCPGGVCGGPRAPFSSLEACRNYGFDSIPCRNGSCSIK